MVYALRCPCGLEITGESEDALVDAANAHLAVQHQRLAGAYAREDILSLAYRRPVPSSPRESEQR